MPLSDRYHGQPERTGFVLGYGGSPVEEIPRAVRRLRDLLAAAEA
jgi:DNA-binding transcriptional MocR family regulator